MAGADFFDIRIKRLRQPRRHAAGLRAIPIVVASALVQALQTIVSRNADPLAGGGRLGHADPCRLGL